MIDQMKIGGFLRELRKEKELTQEQLAEKFGVSSRSVSRWENGVAGVDGYYKTIRNCFFVAYGGILIGSIITAMEVLTWLGVLLIVVSMFSVIAMFIFYGIFYATQTDFLKL